MADDRVAGTVRNVGGKVQEGVGKLTGDIKTQAEGKVNQALGAAEDLYGQAKDAASQAADTMKAGASDAADYVANLVKERPYTVAVGAFFWAGSWPIWAPIVMSADAAGNAGRVMAEISPETQDRLSRVLGKAVAKVWGALPQDLQQQVFEAAVLAEGEVVRQQLAIFLHSKHERTTAAAKARAIPEPDSKGG